MVIVLGVLFATAWAAPGRPSDQKPSEQKSSEQKSGERQPHVSGGCEQTPAMIPPVNLPPPGTEDDPSGGGGGSAGNPVYTDLPASMMLNADLTPAEGRPVPEQLLGRLIDLHSAMDYQAAAEVALQLVDAAPDRSLSHYNLACVMAKLNRPEAALAALDRAVDCGWRSVMHMTLDPDLQSLRDSEAFARIIEKLKAKVAEEKITAVPLRTDELSVIVQDLEAKVPELLKRYHVPGVTLALVRDGRVVWLSAHGVNDAAGSQDSPALVDSTVFRLRTPMQVLALIAGAQQQQRGMMQLSDILTQGAELERMEGVAQRGNGRGDGRPDDQDTRQTGAGVTPVASHTSRAIEDPMTRPNARLYVRSGSAAYGFLRVAVEMTSRQDFGPYCTQNILVPFDMVSTSFHGPCKSEIDRLAIGHTPMGTAVAPHCPGEDRAVGGCLYTTAQDMGRLIESMLAMNVADPNATVNSPDQAVDPIQAMSRVAAGIPGGLSMAVSVDRIKNVGRRVQVIDRTDGQGCLLRWYPANRSGIAVMFNSATGVEAAERIAHAALGGP